MMKWNEFVIGLSLSGMALLGSGCASITSLTTAKTLEAGASEWTAAATYSNLKLNLNTQDLQSGDTSATAPGIDVAYRYGLTNDDEVGVRLSGTLTYYQADYKRALLREGPFALSLGAGVGGTHYSIGDTSSTIVDFYVPTVYGDYNIADGITLFTAPKYIYRVSSLSGAGGSQLAVSGGVKWGKTSGVIVEGGWSKFFRDGISSGWQFALGGFF